MTVPLVHPAYPYVPVVAIPIPVPVDSKESAPSNATLVGIKFTGDAGEEPEEDKPLSVTTPAKAVGNSVYGELVDIEAKQAGKPLPRAPKKVKMENPMAGVPIGLTKIGRAHV